MNYSFFSSLLLFFTFQIGIAQPVQLENKLLENLVEEKGVVGVAAAYAVNGDIKWSGSHGFACKKEERSFTNTTLTRIASISKSMTAIAIMQLAEKGKIDLDISINSYLPEFPNKERGEITIRHLLAHTSGISQYQNTKEVENSLYFKNLDEAMKVFENRPLLFEPGSDFFYTTYGYVILGRIIEVISNLSYEDYMAQNIWQPAGMQNTSVEKASNTYNNKACLYHKNRRKAKAAKPNDLSNRIPGGGIISTLDDMLSFGIALLEGKLISAESLDAMMEIQFTAKEGNPYGLGFFLYGPPPNEQLVIGHSGEQTGCASQLMLIPKSKTVVIVLSNTSGTWKDIVNSSAELIRLSEM